MDKREQRHLLAWEKCAHDLYYHLDLFPDVKWKDQTEEVQNSYRNMVAVVFKALFEMEPTEVALLFVDGRPL